MDKKKFYTQDEAKDILIGKVGTPQHNNYERDLTMFLIGLTVNCIFWIILAYIHGLAVIVADEPTNPNSLTIKTLNL
ncbi:hypothetical protein EZS27_015773 [termite gut metagenome]|uniref:Uncharacterized protein n=1 Tax=termite gut metagenome TaxID=433724 RepID=A0A5J4RQR3_9ZZZZ